MTPSIFGRSFLRRSSGDLNGRVLGTDKTEISISTCLSSSFESGGKRGSRKAALTALSETDLKKRLHGEDMADAASEIAIDLESDESALLDIQASRDGRIGRWLSFEV